VSITEILPTHADLGRSLGAWVEQLVVRFPDFDEYDLAGMVEEKTGVRVFQRDFEAIRAFYLRAKLHAWSPDTSDEEE